MLSFVLCANERSLQPDSVARDMLPARPGARSSPNAAATNLRRDSVIFASPWQLAAVCKFPERRGLRRSTGSVSAALHAHRFAHRNRGHGYFPQAPFPSFGISFQHVPFSRSSPFIAITPPPFPPPSLQRVFRFLSIEVGSVLPSPFCSIRIICRFLYRYLLISAAAPPGFLSRKKQINRVCPRP